MTSANDIAVPNSVPPAVCSLPSDAPQEQVNALFRGFRQLMKNCAAAGCNQHECLDVLISAFIDAGIDRGSHIIGAAKRLDFDGRHAGIRLSEGIGHRWIRDADGTYRNLM